MHQRGKQIGVMYQRVKQRGDSIGLQTNNQPLYIPKGKEYYEVCELQNFISTSPIAVTINSR